MEESPFANFLKRNGLRQLDNLGEGKDGVVIQTDRPSAAKWFRQEELYRRELRMYRVLYGSTN